ncbi:MAG: hypothetical protein HYY44_05995 [Deltaproteobacteria bacterium]|nr:hypothetical protein [Deltaproteobacteria bacterium]
MSGHLVVEITMPVPEGERSMLLANREQIEALGVAVAADGSSVIFPDVTPAGWKVTLGNESTFIDKKGDFTIDVVSGGATEGDIFPHSETVSWGTFTVNQLELIAGGKTPSTITLALDFQGGCCMESGNACCEQPSTSSSITLKETLWSSYPTGKETTCLDYDGPVNTGNNGSVMAYLGSTCFKRVVAGCCPNEGGTPGQKLFPQFYTYASCSENHKGRFCQEVTPGDITLNPSEIVEVSLDEEEPITVHNNGCVGESNVRKRQDQLGGEFRTESFFDGSTVKHYEGQSIANYHYSGADRTLTYITPVCIGSADLKDKYTFQTDGESLTLTFQLDATNHYQFTSGASSGTIFNGNKATEDGFTFGSVDVGCDSLHLHGNHPCTGEADPDPTGCGHGKIQAVP